MEIGGSVYNAHASEDTIVHKIHRLWSQTHTVHFIVAVVTEHYWLVRNCITSLTA